MQNTYSVPLVIEYSVNKMLRKSNFFQPFNSNDDHITLEETIIAEYWPVDVNIDGLLGISTSPGSQDTV